MDPKVLILMGSDSDWEVMSEAKKALDDMGVSAEVHVSSAHRTPERTGKLAREAAGRGVQVIVCGAGAAAHLAGVCAAETELPVLGVPLAARSPALRAQRRKMAEEVAAKDAALQAKLASQKG